MTEQQLREPSANHIAECGGPCEQGFWNCDCGLLYELNPDLQPQASAPAGGLVERVALAICRCDDLSSWREEAINWSPEARAAILAVANWVVLQSTDSGRLFACWLQEEAERG